MADVFGRRKDEVFLHLQALLEPFGITQYRWLGTTMASPPTEEGRRCCANGLQELAIDSDVLLAK